MAESDYYKALNDGLLNYYTHISHGETPFLPVLDDILENVSIVSRVELGLVDIPLDLIVGTSTYARTVSFASNFMPIVDDESEFADKWIKLSNDLLSEGQREPVKAYEYMNKFYIVEGNKRVSVSKYLKNVSVYGNVTRLVPKKTNERENIIYYEFLDFYEITKINYLWFSKPGSFSRFLEFVNPQKSTLWDVDTQRLFRSNYLHFEKEYLSKGGAKLSITTADAMLAYITIYGYDNLLETPAHTLGKNLSKIWNEFLMISEENSIALILQPNTKHQNILLRKFKSLTAGHLKVAFIHAKTAETSAWTYSHELGRTHLEQHFKDSIQTYCIEDADTKDTEQLIEDAIERKCDIIFTTSPELMIPSLRAAINHPDKKILNCSLNTSHRYIRTYYGRMYEAKFLSGAIAATMSRNGKIGYIADYPIYGMAANINAFALGAKLINPYAKVYLEWSTIKGSNPEQAFVQNGVYYISGKEMVIPGQPSRRFGLYRESEVKPVNIAMPIWHWGIFYEKLIQSIISGSFKNEEASKTNQALNYWWGMSAGVVDMICSEKLPDSIINMVSLLKQAICSENFNPFYGKIYSNDGTLVKPESTSFSPDEIITMDWLADNVIGSIPDINQLKEEAKPVVLMQGLINNEFIKQH